MGIKTKLVRSITLFTLSFSNIAFSLSAFICPHPDELNESLRSGKYLQDRGKIFQISNEIFGGVNVDGLTLPQPQIGEFTQASTEFGSGRIKCHYKNNVLVLLPWVYRPRLEESKWLGSINSATCIAPRVSCPVIIRS